MRNSRLRCLVEPLRIKMREVPFNNTDWSTGSLNGLQASGKSEPKKKRTGTAILVNPTSVKSIHKTIHSNPLHQPQIYRVANRTMSSHEGWEVRQNVDAFRFLVIVC
jgi:hypothetical protein